MTITEETRNAVLKLNDLLRQELGFPQHAWIWSEDLTVSMRVPDKYEHKADPETGLLILLPVFTTRRQLPFHAMRWVMCTKGFVDERTWLDSIGTRMEYPANGMWQVIGTPTGPMCLNQGEVPTLDLTWAAIRSVRQERGITMADFRHRTEAQVDKRDSAGGIALRELVKDTITKTVPGTKGSVSYPAVGSSIQL